MHLKLLSHHHHLPCPVALCALGPLFPSTSPLAPRPREHGSHACDPLQLE